MRTKTWLCASLAIAALTLTACDSQAPIPNTAAPLGSAGAIANPVFATELAGPATYLPPLPTAVVVLRADDLNRNRAFCASFMQMPTAAAVSAASIIAPNIIRTRWLTQLTDMPASRTQDCDFLTGSYDYTRAAGLIATLRPDGVVNLGRGPFLLMLIPTDHGVRAVGLDGSGYAEADFGQFIRSWNSAVGQTQLQIATQPNQLGPDHTGIVRSVFNLVAAIMRTVAGAAGGAITGTVNGL